MNIPCYDGTKILSDTDEVNELLRKGWILVETGIIGFKSVPRNGAPFTICFRLKENQSKSIQDDSWDNLSTKGTLQMEINSVESVKHNISEVRIINSIRERDDLHNTGWMLLKESKRYFAGNSNQYALGLLKEKNIL